MKVRNNLKVLLLVVLLSVMFLPCKVFGAETYYWTSNLSETNYNLFQEDATSEIETNGYIGMTVTGAYKFVFYNGKNYIAMNSDAGYSSDVNSLLSEMLVTEKDGRISFTPFLDTEDYTPKTYKDMLNKAKILVYDKNNNLVKSMPALDYKKYTKFPVAGNKFNVKFDSYINDGEIVTGVSLNISWNLPDGDTPLTLEVINKKADFDKSFDMQDNLSKGNINIALDLAYNGKYTFLFTTMNTEYSTELTFDKLSLDILDEDEGEKDGKLTYTEGEKISNANVKISVSGLPKGNINAGDSFQLIVKTNVDTNIDMNGRVDSNYQKKHKFNITKNGVYTILATSEAGKSATKKITVNCFVEPKDDGAEYYSRDAYWTGTHDITNEEKLAQTGMYDSTLLVVGILTIFAAVLVFAEILRKEGLTWKRK